MGALAKPNQAVKTAFAKKKVQAERLLNDSAQHHLIARFALGEIVLDLANEAQYGASAVERLGEELDVSTTLLYDAGRIASVYTRAQIDALIKKSTDKGRTISYSHVRLLSLMTGSDANAQRAALEKEIINKGLSVDDTNERLAILRGTAGLGKKGLIARTPMAGLKQMRLAADSISAKLESWDEGIFERINQDDALDASSAMLDEIQETIARQLALRESISTVIAKLTEAGKTVEKALTGQQTKARTETIKDAAEDYTHEDEPPETEPVAAITIRRTKRVQEGVTS